ncbi:MAG: glycerophosphodiester phosphodiesterase family protein [Turneriella sp.]|nr:hypothetical protein [Leptospiraceae bacterium]MCX7633421.1 glycerophosphodiester phosphodiesterase family protein [Turneriella sp.]
MIAVFAIAIVFAISLGLLAVRYHKHKPRNFNSHFPRFQPQLATHRGYGKHGEIPENTLRAFLAAEKLGFRAHELDVRRTQDRVIVLLHGPRLEQTTDGTGRIEDWPADKVFKLNAAHYLKREHPKSHIRFEKIPTLEEVLAKISKKSLINVEIKRDRWDFSRGLEEETLKVVLQSPARNRVFFSGFHFLTLWRLRRLRCPLPIGLLVEPGIFCRLKNFIYRVILLPDNIHLHHSCANEQYIKKLRRRGFGIAFWTVNELSKVRALFAHGADIVITDRTDFLRKLR